MKIRPILILLFFVTSFLPTFGQVAQPLKSVVSVENQYLYANMRNYIMVVAQQPEPVTLDQLQATFQGYGSEEIPIEITAGHGRFIIRPDTAGIVKINITIGDTIETKFLRVKPIEAVARLSRHGANSDEKISVGEFKAQGGIGAFIECCGFEATCQVIEFQTIRISVNNEIERAINDGARFDSPTQEIIMKASPGDMFIFRQIKCLFPGSSVPQRLGDMIFEIK